MVFKIEDKGKYTLITTTVDKLDTTVAPDLKSEITFLNKNGVKYMVIDLSGVKYCDSSGLSAILVANRMCNNQGGSFVLTGLEEPVRKLIAISQLDSILNIADNINKSLDLLFTKKSGNGFEADAD